jgi:acetyl-CoA carboxylase alpha subunit
MQNTSPSLLTSQLVQQICDEFIELRRQRANFGKDRLIGGFATIGRYSVLILVHGENGRRGKNRIPESARGRASGFRKADHLMQLAYKFRKPIVVCFVAPPSSSRTIAAESREDLCLPKHILSQWYLDVPIILVILTSKSAYDIFGVWLADKAIALEQAQFVMSIPGQGKQRRINVRAEELLRGGVIDKTIPASSKSTRHSQAVMLYRLRAVLIQMLDEVAGGSLKELRARRQERLARLEAMVANVCGRAQ